MKVIGIAKDERYDKEYLVLMTDQELANLTGHSSERIRNLAKTGVRFDVVDTYKRARKTLGLYRELENNLDHLHDHLTTFKELLRVAEESGEIEP